MGASAARRSTNARREEGSGEKNTMSILEYNGAAIIGMVGKNCVGIASDSRYGIQNMTVGNQMQKIFKVNNKTFVGLAGLATDVQTLQSKLQFRNNMYKLREERDMNCRTFKNMLSHMVRAPVWAVVLRACDCWTRRRGKQTLPGSPGSFGLSCGD